MCVVPATTAARPAGYSRPMAQRSDRPRRRRRAARLPSRLCRRLAARLRRGAEGTRPAGLLADGPLGGRPARRGPAGALPQALRRDLLDLGAGDRGRDRGLQSPARCRLRPGLRLGARGRVRVRPAAQPARPRLSDRARHRHRQCRRRAQPQGRRHRRAESGSLRRRLPALPARPAARTCTRRWCCARRTAARTSARRCRCWRARSTPTCPTSPATGWRADRRYLRWLSSESGGV